MRWRRQSLDVLIYRAILRLLPRGLWKDYEEEMVEFYRRRRSEVGPGWWRRLGFVVTVLIDEARHGPLTWLDNESRPRSGRARRLRRSRAGIHSVLQDSRFGMRILRRRPLFAAMTILTLGVGIGSATIMYSVVDWVLLRPLPYADPDQVVSVWQVFPGFKEIANLRESWDKGWLSHEQFESWREHQTSFSAVAIHDRSSRQLTGFGRAEVLDVGRGSAALMDVLGVSLSKGRWFTLEEENGEPETTVRPLAQPVVVVSHEFWQERMGGRQDVLGQTLTLDRRPHTIIGVLPPAFRLRILSWGGIDVGLRDVWIPAPKDGGYHWDGIGRLKPGVTAAQAKAELEALLLSDIDPSQRWFNVIPRARAENVDLETPLMLLLAGTGLLLLIACGNVSTLLLGEMQTRRHELAIRCALGASRSRLARHLFTESLILGALGSCVGTIFAMVGTPLLVRFGPSIPYMDQISVDLRVLAAGVALAIASAVVFGVPSAYVVTREGASIHLRARALGFGKKASRLSACVVGAEVALTTIILISSVLLGRSFSEMMAVTPGFIPESLAVIAVEPPPLSEGELGGYLSFLEQTSDRLSQVEGVSEVAASSGVPFLQTNSSYVVTPADAQEDAPSISALSWYVSADFRRVMGIPLLAGRDLTPAEVSQGAHLTLVSESLARELWPDRSPLGETLRYTESDVLTVVGIVGDIKHKALGYQTEAAFHLPVFDGDRWRLPSNFVVRTRAGAAARLDSLKAAVWDLDPDALIREATTMETLISRSVYPDRYRTLLTGIFATFATFLAAIGLFGVTARSVAQRNSDMAIRMALGARSSTLIRDVLRGGLRVALAGIATGLLLSLWAGYLIRDFLFDVAPEDPLTYLGVAGGLILTSILASYLPARRAASVDPIETLRSE